MRAYVLIVRFGTDAAQRRARSAFAQRKPRSSLSGYGHFPPAGCLAPIPVAEAGIATPQQRTLKRYLRASFGELSFQVLRGHYLLGQL